LQVREATESDTSDILAVHRAAFDEEDVAGLVAALLQDPTAKPVLSLVAVDADRVVGHVMFTKARIDRTDPGRDDGPVTSLLAPLAVVPERQRQDVGGQLVRRGLQLLSESGVELVFVLGHPSYYPRHGFQPAGRHGLDAPYSIPDKDADAWMVQQLRPNLIGTVRGALVCANALDAPEYWRE